jgi:uncharacterized repeat protein (TIGR03806 family)
LALAGCGGGGGSSGGGSGSYGLDARVGVSGLQIPTAPAGSGPVRAVNAFPGLSLPGATSLVAAGDGSNRFFSTDRNGVVKVFAIDGNVTQASTVVDISAKVDDSAGENGMLGLAFDPAFTSNRYFYVSYVTTGTRKVRVSRFTMNSVGGSIASAASETTVLEYDHPSNDHFGGWLAFGPDGMLYLSTGDGGNQQLVQNTSSLFGKILRIRINSNATYSIPSDNPFAGSPVWAYGFRNPWRCSFDRAATTADGNLWCGDVGQSDREEVNRVNKGANYGWPYFEGDLAYDNPGNRPYSDFEPAVYQYSHTTGVAVIGGFVYRGSAMPSLAGRYLYSDFNTPELWAVRTDGSGNFVDNTEVASIGQGQPQTIGQGPSGEIYLVTGQGMVYRFEETGGGGSAATMPATLSATGLFTDTAALTPAPFMIDYTVNAPFWSNGAAKRRWFVLPDGQSIQFAADGPWTFPVGTITVKHFDLPLADGSTTRVETRVMVHRTNGWAGFTYRWRADQQDADLLSDDASATYQALDPATNTATTLTYNFPSPAQCLQCHTQATGRVLGLNTLQFNGNHTYAATGRGDNQLRTLNHIGVFSQDIGAASQFGAMPDPANESAALDTRARAYLDTNCSICHRPGGPTPVNMDLRYTTSLADTLLVGVGNQASIAGTRVVAGNHANSLLWQRAGSSAGSVRMPPVGVSLVDGNALQMLANWIDSLQ